MNHPDLNRAPLWWQMGKAAGLVDESGTLGQTVFGEMTELAQRTSAVNLGQGAPSLPTPDFLIAAAHQAMVDGFNQYPPPQGHPHLREAIATERTKRFGYPVVATNVLVTVGATEALTAAIVALTQTGGTVVAFEPYYDSYAAAAQLAGATLTPVPLLAQGNTFVPDWDEFDRVVQSAGTGGNPPISAIIVNTPHNPTGLVLSPEDLLRIHAAAEHTDSWVITDEVYEHLVFEPYQHVPLAQLVPDSRRVVTVSSAGKTFNATGWKIGWLIASSEVITAVQSVKQYFTFASGHPLQIAVAEAINNHPEFPPRNRDTLSTHRDLLAGALSEIPGMRVSEPGAGYFLIADFAGVTNEDAQTLNARLSTNFGFTGIPVPRLCRPGSPTAQAFARSIRYSFCKTTVEMERAANAIRAFATSLHSANNP